MEYTDMRKSLNRVATIATSIAMVSTMLLNGSAAHAAPVTAIHDTLSREKVSVAGVTHALVWTQAGAENGNLDIVYTNFTALAFVSGTCTGGTIVDNTTAANTLHVTLAGCTAGTDTVNFTATNPAAAGSQAMSFAGTYTGTGSFAEPITLDDQIQVSASVNPFITFQVTTDHTGANAVCSHGTSGSSVDHTPATDGGLVALGLLDPSYVASSDALRVGAGANDGDYAGAYVDGTNIQHICTFVSTNAGSGYALTVKSENGALSSDGTPADTIPQTPITAAPTAQTATPGTERYVMCLSTSDVPNMDTTTPAGTNLTATAPYNSGTCTGVNTAQAGGELSTATAQIGSNTGAVQEGAADWLVKASIAATTKAHADYDDTLTFIATGTF
jgi:hypothetical protein